LGTPWVIRVACTRFVELGAVLDQMQTEAGTLALSADGRVGQPDLGDELEPRELDAPSRARLWTAAQRHLAPLVIDGQVRTHMVSNIVTARKPR